MLNAETPVAGASLQNELNELPAAQAAQALSLLQSAVGADDRLQRVGAASKETVGNYIAMSFLPMFAALIPFLRGVDAVLHAKMLWSFLGIAGMCAAIAWHRYSLARYSVWGVSEKKLIFACLDARDDAVKIVDYKDVHAIIKTWREIQVATGFAFWNTHAMLGLKDADGLKRLMLFNYDRAQGVPESRAGKFRPSRFLQHRASWMFVTLMLVFIALFTIKAMTNLAR